MKKIIENLSSKTKSVLKKGTVATLCTFMIGAGVFYACNKEGVLDNKQEQVVDPVKGFIEGYFGYAILVNVTKIGTYYGEIPANVYGTPCYSKTWKTPFYYQKANGSWIIVGYEIVTRFYDCSGKELWATGTFIEVIERPYYYGTNPDEIDYSDITNFRIYVGNYGTEANLVVPGFSYVKPVSFVHIEDGVSSTYVGEFHITYEDIINLWEELHPQLNWEEVDLDE